jgi:DNA-binding protein HU-beta
MNKGDFIEELAIRLSCTKTDAKVMIETVTDIIAGALQNEEEVRLPGLGIWKLHERKERNGVNPKTGERIVIPAKQVVKYKSSIKL